MDTEQAKKVTDALGAIGVKNFVIALPDPDELETFYVFRMSDGVAYDLGRVKDAVVSGARHTEEVAGFRDDYSVIKNCKA